MLSLTNSCCGREDVGCLVVEPRPSRLSKKHPAGEPSWGRPLHIVSQFVKAGSADPLITNSFAQSNACLPRLNLPPIQFGYLL